MRTNRLTISLLLATASLGLAAACSDGSASSKAPARGAPSGEDGRVAPHDPTYPEDDQGEQGAPPETKDGGADSPTPADASGDVPSAPDGVKGSCVDGSLESKVPLTATGSTEGRSSDYQSNRCDVNALGGGDVSFTWTAPRAGNFQIDTLGSSYNARLHVRSTWACDGAFLECGEGGTAGTSLRVTLAAGERILITVDSHEGEFGPFLLHITE